MKQIMEQYGSMILYLVIGVLLISFFSQVLTAVTSI